MKRRCWAPNGLDLMEWPLGQGYVPAGEDDLSYREHQAKLRRRGRELAQQQHKKFRELKELERAVLASKDEDVWDGRDNDQAI